MRLDEYGFIERVKLCIELIQSIQDKITPEELNQYLQGVSEEYFTTKEFLSKVVDMLQVTNDGFVLEMQELYNLSEQVREAISLKNIGESIELTTQKVAEATISKKEFMEALAQFLTQNATFRRLLYAYSNTAVKEEIKKLDFNNIVIEIVKENADAIANLVMTKTKMIECEALAALFVTQQVELRQLMRYGIIIGDGFFHLQEIPKWDGNYNGIPDKDEQQGVNNG